MKLSILNQRNVCALLGILMALTIVWTAKAGEVVEMNNMVLPMTENRIGFEEGQLEFDGVDLSEFKEIPAIVIIDINGKIVAELYGNKNDLVKRYNGLIEPANFLTSSGFQDFYLE